MLNILIPVDGSKSALTAVKHVIHQRVLHAEPIKVALTNVQPRLPRHITRFASAKAVRQLQAERAEEAMKDAMSMLTAAGVPYDLHVYKGNVAEQIAQGALQMEADKIVMGTTRKNALTRFFQGSVVNRVMALTEKPVEIVARGEAGKLERFGIPVGVGLAFLWLAVE
ncbi:universal stress protein [Oxalicibacterium faecigallinarum]|uniref:Universal stress protein n=1 Tax=Oxalicibacterium faecigallinarum TaxID=573741 RepID=A0A8J3AWQ3_9BURK|nr:universal stress protein [Oxalicibacterium faecigallinarum]GGI21085.1 universal stress protein [Oxalicibacterium faecigallinarum]